MTKLEQRALKAVESWYYWLTRFGMNASYRRYCRAFSKLEHAAAALAKQTKKAKP